MKKNQKPIQRTETLYFGIDDNPILAVNRKTGEEKIAFPDQTPNEQQMRLNDEFYSPISLTISIQSKMQIPDKISVDLFGVRHELKNIELKIDNESNSFSCEIDTDFPVRDIYVKIHPLIKCELIARIKGFDN